MLLVDEFSLLIIHLNLIHQLLHLLFFFLLFLHPVCLLQQRTFSLFRSIADKDIKNISHRIAVNIMTIIIHPPDRSILSDNTVLYIIQIILAGCNLFPDTLLNGIQILVMHKAAKGISSKLPEFHHRITLKDPQKRFIGIDDLFCIICMIDKESSRHFIHKPNDLICHLKFLRTAKDFFLHIPFVLHQMIQIRMLLIQRLQ